MKQASITVYLTLVLTVLIALFATCIEGARIQAVKLKILYASDAAAVSCFAEYRKELFDVYDLLFVDISYGGSCTDTSILEDRLETTFEENCYPTRNIPIVFRRTLLGVEETDVEIEGILLATDYGGEVFKEAAALYIKNKYGITAIEMLAAEVKSYEAEGFFSTDLEEEWITNEKEIEEIAVVAKEEVEDGEITWEEVEVDNPADNVNNTRKGVLNLVVSDSAALPANYVNLTSYASHRQNTEGSLALEIKDSDQVDIEEKSVAELTLEELYFSEYVLEKCGNYLQVGESNLLTYECEYVIAGGESDIENLRKVVNRILLIREAANVVHILADAVKMGELETVAAGLAAVTTVPALQPVIKYSLVLAWGYAEGVYDVKRLLEGERVAMYKTTEQWKLSLENMLIVEALDSTSAEVEKEIEGDLGGLSYQDYLRILVYMVNPEYKVFRMMDVVEMKVRSMGYEDFRLDTCSNQMEIAFVALDKNGKMYEEKKRQKYK